MSDILLESYDSVDSTMDIALDLARKGAPEGTVIVARRQNRGRGRFGSTWVSPEGGAWFSLILRPTISSEQSHRVVLLAGMCVCKVLRELLKLNTTLRWPNDVLLERRKIAGVLGEGTQTDDTFCVIAGIGVNTNFSSESFPEWVRRDAVTTLDSLGTRIDNELLIREIAGMIVERSPELATDYERVLEDWTRLSDTIGRTIQIDGVTIGKAMRLDSQGFLIVRDSMGGEQRLVSGRIRYLEQV